MHWLYLVTLALTLWLTANYLWKIEQVYAIAVKLAGLLSFMIGFAYAPHWGQLLVATLLISRYCLYSYAYHRAL